MRFALLFGMTDETWSHVSAEETARVDEEIGAWWKAKVDAGTLISGVDLQPSSTAKTVRLQGGEPVVTDGRFTSGEDVLGGYAIVDVADFDTAVELAKTWPGLQVPGESVEVRPMHG